MKKKNDPWETTGMYRSMKKGRPQFEIQQIGQPLMNYIFNNQCESSTFDVGQEFISDVMP